MNKQSLDERIFDLPIVNEAYVDASAVKQLIRDVITEVTPERLEPKPEDYDGYGDYSHVIRMQQATVDQVHTNLNNLLGEKQ